MNVLPLALRMLRRDWKLPELRTLALALVLAVSALGVVATLAARVENGVIASAAQLIGGDAGVSSQAALPEVWTDKANELGLQSSRSARFPSVAFANERSELLDVSASDSAWPLRGTLELIDARGRQWNGHGPTTGIVYLDHRALVALDRVPGEYVQLGGQRLAIGAELLRQPDGGELLALAPRALMSLADARRAGLLATGSRAQHRFLVAGAAEMIERWRAWAEQQMPAGASLITPARVEERMRSAFDRAGSFLRLTALLAALLSGVAIALAAQRYARRKTDEVALLRALGTPWRRVLALLCTNLALLALPAVVLGAALALGLAQIVWMISSSVLADAASALPLQPALAAALIGLAVLAGFTLPPLVRLAGVPPVAVFRRQSSLRGRRFDILYLIPVLVALLLIFMQTSSPQLAGVLAVSLAGVVLLALMLAAMMLWLARRFAARVHPAWRLGLAALTRHRMLSLIQSVALSLGLTALLLLGIIAPAMLDGWRRELPADTPNWFVLNIQDPQREALKQDLKTLGAQQINMLPLATAKLTAINGQAVNALQLDNPQANERIERPLRLTWSGTMSASNRVLAGRWHGLSPAQAEVSVASMWRDLFGLNIGDDLRFEVGERTLEARITSIREVDWSSFEVNFFLVLDPAHAADLPHTWLASYYLEPGHAGEIAALSRDYPNLSLIDVDAVLERIREIVARVSSAVRWVLVFSLLAGALVLAAALASSAQERRHEAALLRTLGASAAQLRAAAACEFALLGLIAGLTAAAGAAGSGLWLALSVFELDSFKPPLGSLLGAAALAAAVVMLLGLVGTRKVASTSPLILLRRA